jgi:lysophospholipase L1-like esterase
MIADAVAARGARVVLFDLRKPFLQAADDGRQGPFTIDGVHLAARGADVVAAAFADLIESLLHR